MPAKNGFCWCFGRSAPPEITLAGPENGMSLKPMTMMPMDLPMPTDEEELNAKFAELVVSTRPQSCLIKHSCSAHTVFSHVNVEDQSDSQPGFSQAK